TNLARFDQLVHHAAHHVRWTRKPNPNVSTVAAAHDLRVDSDEFSVRIDERAARVALINWRVGLQKVLKVATSQSRGASFGADNSHRYGLADIERISDCQRHVADAD